MLQSIRNDWSNLRKGLRAYASYLLCFSKGEVMRVKKMEDLDPHSMLFEQMALSGNFLPRYGNVNITYYKRYRQADITPPEGYEVPLH